MSMDGSAGVIVPDPASPDAVASVRPVDAVEPLRSLDEVERLREQVGRSASLWAGADGVSFQPAGWTALSGARSPAYNLMFTAGDGDDLDAGVERLLAARVPAVAMIAGPALAHVQQMVKRDWICIGATPMMVLPLDREFPSPPAAVAAAPRRLDDAHELAEARALIARVFEVGPELAEVALPVPMSDAEIVKELWGAYDASGVMRSCLAMTRVGRTASGWSMATCPTVRGQGFGRWLLEAALNACAAAGATEAVASSSPAGEPFYRRLGFVEVERWQMWSRPRWVLGRA